MKRYFLIRTSDWKGRSTDSRFCPHCGKFMINSTMPVKEDE